MALRTATYALDRPVPYLLEQGYSSAGGASGQTITAPIRRTSDGALVVPTASGSTVTILSGGTTVVSAAAVAVADSVAGYTFTAGQPALGASLGEGWEVQWSLVIDGEVYSFRSTAILCEYVPPNCITAADLYGGEGIPELRFAIPQAQATDRGDGTGWAPQIDAAYYALIRRMLADGRPIWRSREPSGYREWLLAQALKNACDAIPAPEGSIWKQYRTDAYHRLQRAEAGLKLQFDDQPAGRRSAGVPVYRLAPVGRPQW